MSLASVRSLHTRSCVRSGPTYLSSETLQLSHPGSACVRNARSLVGRSSSPRLDVSATACLSHSVWVLIRFITPTTISESSSDAGPAVWVDHKPSPRLRTRSRGVSPARHERSLRRNCLPTTRTTASRSRRSPSSSTCETNGLRSHSRRELMTPFLGSGQTFLGQVRSRMASFWLARS